MDLQLRRRGIKSVLLCGVSTNMGVESTARQAWEYGYQLVILEDLCSSRFILMHDFACKEIFPLIAQVVDCDDVEFY